MGMVMNSSVRVKDPAAQAMGLRLRQIREEQGLVQAEVAYRLGISDQGYGSYEQGRTRLFATDLPRLARALGVDLGVLTDRLGLKSESDRVTVRPVRMGAFVYLPVISNVRVDAGTYGWIPVDAGVMVEAELTRGRDLMPLLVSGSCLTPEVYPGDIVVIDRANHEPQNHDLVVIVTEDGEALLKRYVANGNGGLLEDNEGRQLRPDGARLEGVVELLQRKVRGRRAQ